MFKNVPHVKKKKKKKIIKYKNANETFAEP